MKKSGVVIDTTTNYDDLKDVILNHGLNEGGHDILCFEKIEISQDDLNRINSIRKDCNFLYSKLSNYNNGYWSGHGEGYESGINADDYHATC
jgi:hypothetical protein